MQITHHTITPDPTIAAKIVWLAMQNTSHLTLEGVPAGSPWYAVTQVALACEISAYLASMGNPKSNIRAELILATEASHGASEVVGFQLILPVNECPDACGVIYMAVASGHRRKGIARKMNAVAIERYPHAELSCFIDSVPAFESLGYKVIGGYETQVRMCTRSKSAAGVMTKLDSQQFAHTAQVQQQILDSLSALTPAEVEASQQAIADSIVRRAKEVAAFVSARLVSGSTSTP